MAHCPLQFLADEPTGEVTEHQDLSMESGVAQALANEAERERRAPS